MIALKNVLVATDFSEPSDAALVYGKNFARTFGATLHVLHIADDIIVRGAALAGTTVNAAQLQADTEAEARRSVDALINDDDRRTLGARGAVLTSTTPGHAIVNYASDISADLVIVGTHGRSGIAQFFMGSTAQQVVRTAPCPVLTVRHPERDFVRPDALQTTASK